MLLEWLAIIGERVRRLRVPPTPPIRPRAVRSRPRDRGMYQVTQLQAGGFTCWGMVQDGSERWEERTLKKAVDSMIVFAKVMNHSTITQDDISISCADPAYNSA